MWGYIFSFLFVIGIFIAIIIDLLRIPSVFLILCAYLLGRHSKK